MGVQGVRREEARGCQENPTWFAITPKLTELHIYIQVLKKEKKEQQDAEFKGIQFKEKLG